MRQTAPILEEIVAVKRSEIARLKMDSPIAWLRARVEEQPSPLNLVGALLGDTVRIIGEVKKASPARGLLRADFNPVSLACSYSDNGAAAVSVLTDGKYFQGCIQHLEAVQKVMRPRGIPVLRKEFILDPHQVYEARAYGADAILLIVAILRPQELRELKDLAEKLWMQSVVEVHDETELGVALDAGAEIIGINNRDLTTFKTDLEVTERLGSFVPDGKIIVSESGIASRRDVRRVEMAGAHAVLVGEALVTAVDPGAKLREFV